MSEKVQKKRSLNWVIWPVIFIFILVTTIYFLYLTFGDLGTAFRKLRDLTGKSDILSKDLQSGALIINLGLVATSITVTAFFSHLVYKINKNALKISESLENNEINKEVEYFRSKALIVYFDLIRSLEFIKKAYIEICIKNKKFVEKNYINDNWIENISLLRKNFSNSETEKLLETFNTIVHIQDELKAESSDVKIIIENFVEKVFLKELPKKLLNYFDNVSTLELINEQYYKIIHSLYGITFTQNEKKIDSYNTTMINDILYKISDNSVTEFYNESGKIKLIMASEKIIEFNSYDADSNLYYRKKFKTDSKEIKLKNVTGKFKEVEEYLIDGCIKKAQKYGKFIEYYDTEIVCGNFQKDDEYGEVKIYSVATLDLKFEGIMKNLFKVKGKEYLNNKVYFEGNYKEDIPYTGKVENYNFPALFIFNYSGEIKEGLPVNGEGEVFKSSKKFSDYEELRKAYDYHLYCERQQEDYEQISVNEELFRLNEQDKHMIQQEGKNPAKYVKAKIIENKLDYKDEDLSINVTYRPEPEYF